jgi:glycopeptide antibiotics resistance protein
MRRVCLIGLVFYLLYIGAVTLAPFDFQVISQPHRWEKSLLFSFSDVVANLLLFLPVGGLLYGSLPARPRLPRLMSTFLLSAAVSLSVEMSQLFLPERFSSFGDFIANTLGGGAGFLLFKALGDRGWFRWMWHYRQGLAQLGLLLYVGFLLFLAGFSWEKLDRWDTGALLWIGVDPEMEDGWKGKVYRLAIYDQAFDPDTIRRHYQAGISARPESYLQQNPIVLYLFDEREGSTLHDRAEVLPPLDLQLSNPGRGRWLSPFGYVFNRSASFISPGPTEKVRQRISSRHQFVVEAWVEMGPLPYRDRGRLISLAKAPDIDYFLLQQGGIDLGFEVRNRIKTGFPNLGNIETTQLPFLQGPTHLISVYDRGVTRLYVNGALAAEAILTDGLFLLTDSLALRTTVEGERGLLGFLLFLPVGSLAVLSVRIRSASGLFTSILFALLVLVVIHLLQSRHNPVFFAGGYLLAPFFAILSGALSSKFIQETVQRSSEK